MLPSEHLFIYRTMTVCMVWGLSPPLSSPTYTFSLSPLHRPPPNKPCSVRWERAGAVQYRHLTSQHRRRRPELVFPQGIWKNLIWKWEWIGEWYRVCAAELCHGIGIIKILHWGPDRANSLWEYQFCQVVFRACPAFSPDYLLFVHMCCLHICMCLHIYIYFHLSISNNVSVRNNCIDCINDKICEHNLKWSIIDNELFKQRTYEELFLVFSAWKKVVGLVGDFTEGRILWWQEPGHKNFNLIWQCW